MVILRVKENSKQAKAFLELVKTFDFVDFVNMEAKKVVKGKQNLEETYDDTFVLKVLNSYNNDKRQTIESAKLWESI